MSEVIRVVELPPRVVSMGAFPSADQAQRAMVTLVGAGGVGARIAPLLIKHMIPGDCLRIVDDDVVEMKNVRRQHFTRGDVGRPKAEVVAERALAAAPMDGIVVDALVTRFGANLVEDRWERYGPTLPVRTPTGQYILHNPTILITAVDNLDTRREIANHFAGREWMSGAWIDCGNRNASGQALLALLQGWAVELDATHPVGRRVGLGGLDEDGERRGPWVKHGVVTFDGWSELAPSYLTQAEDPQEDSCGVRLDTQTVMANTWAATAAVTLAVPLLEFKPLVTVGITFSSEIGGAQTAGVRALTPHPTDRLRGTLHASRQLLA